MPAGPRCAFPLRPVLLTVGDQTLMLTLRRHRRARRFVLRVNPDGSGATVTLPPAATAADAIEVARRHGPWLLHSLASLPPRVPFADGAVLPLQGEPHRIIAAFHLPAGVRTEGGHLIVGGAAAGLAARLERWLRRRAGDELKRQVAAKAERFGRQPRRISVRDQVSRWGSCSANGTLSFSWRLILAPAFVLNYVAAHEVVHLAVRGHGPDFWRATAGLAEDMAAARAWLRAHGPSLHRYG